MNDFTKTELIKIKLGLLKLSYVPPGLLPKIQSMIENYCEHEFYQQGCGASSFAQCGKCGEIRRLESVGGTGSSS